VKSLHTVVWALFVCVIMALPVLAWRGRFGWAALASAVVWLECAVLAFNHWHCPLTFVAARYTTNRAANFDIFLPRWLAHSNTRFFGACFVLGELVFVTRWLTAP
jgi:hypothetical protein